DLDFNGHVNSLKYLQWMLDEVPIDFASTHQLWHFDVNYVHETHPNETAVILSNFGEDFTEFEIRNATQLPVCRAFMQWRKF
ncbi:MAG: acyl-[acyl-carrier-protein] thioesterase, partial [Bacteroidales bacterium]|nr:acyl-[acyl-carrier-protein] thioesterase [Bacteroidales bacterium]